MNDYELEITGGGRAGEVSYKEKEQAGALGFWWEFSMDGVIISIPSDAKWNDYCERENVEWAKNRKPEIVERIAAETRRQKASAAVIDIEDEWVNLRF